MPSWRWAYRQSFNAYKACKLIALAVPSSSGGSISHRAWCCAVKVGSASGGHSSGRWRLSSRPKAKAMQVASPQARQLVRGSSS